MTVPIATARSVVATRGALGRLAHGRSAVRMTNSTSVWVASDSRNHPVWNMVSPKWKRCSST